MYTVIPKVTFDEIKDDTIRIMSTIAIYNVDEVMLAVEPNIPPRKTFLTLIERANATFSRHFPLIYIQRINIQPQDRTYTFVDNFNLYVNGTLDPTLVTMVPDAVTGISTVHFHHAKWNPSIFLYQPPTLIFKYKISGLVYAKTICKYRIYTDQNNPANDAIYFIDKRTPIYDIFIKQFVYDFAFFIYNNKLNYSIAELPIDVFSGLEQITSELRNELETLYNENPRNFLLYY